MVQIIIITIQTIIQPLMISVYQILIMHTLYDLMYLTSKLLWSKNISRMYVKMDQQKKIILKQRSHKVNQGGQWGTAGFSHGTQKNGLLWSDNERENISSKKLQFLQT